MLMSVMAYTSSSVSPPSFSSSMFITLLKGFVPAHSTTHNHYLTNLFSPQTLNIEYDFNLITIKVCNEYVVRLLTPEPVHSIDGLKQQDGVTLSVLHKHQQQLERSLDHQTKL